MRSTIDTSNIEVFPGKNLSDLLEDIYEDSSERQETIQGLVDQLSDLIEEPDHANIIVPLIREYLEIGIQNQKQKVEIAKIIQRLESAYVRSNESEDVGPVTLSDAEKNEIRGMVDEFKEEEELKELEKKKNEAVKEIDEES